MSGEPQTQEKFAVILFQGPLLGAHVKQKVRQREALGSPGVRRISCPWGTAHDSLSWNLLTYYEKGVCNATQRLVITVRKGKPKYPWPYCHQPLEEKQEPTYSQDPIMTKSRGLVPLVKCGSGGGQETCFHQNCLHPTNTRKSSAIMEGGAGARTWRKAHP